MTDAKTILNPPTDWLQISPEPLSTERAIAFVVSPLAGGINIFLGTTRTETSFTGHELIALDYQAYEEMAAEQLQKLSTEARLRWPILKLVILHRIDRVKVGEPSVLIAVSTPHRAESFDACRWIIDELKKTVTIWKQEIWADGSASWVHAEPEKQANRLRENQ
jgi:molybdopterin synthase catalytic subunit